MASIAFLFAINPAWGIAWHGEAFGQKNLIQSDYEVSATEEDWVNVLSEDFSKCLAGTEETHDDMMLQDEMYGISDEYTQTPGWTGYGVYQGGGVLAVDAPGYGGFLNTPEISMKGLVRVIGRIKALDENCPVTIVLNRGGIGNPRQVAAEERPRILDIDGWEPFCYTFYNPYEDEAFLQFSRIHRSPSKLGFLIDDLKIDVLPAYIPAVKEIACGEFVPDGFGVRWVKSPFTDNYLVSLYEETTISDAHRTITENFGSWNADADKRLKDIPEEWKVNLRDYHRQLVDTEDGKAIVFGRHEESLELPSWGGRISDLRLTFINDKGENPDAWGTSAMIYGWDGTGWQFIRNFSSIGMEDGESFEIDLGEWEDEPLESGQTEPHRFRGLYSKIKIVTESCNFGACLLLDKVYLDAAGDTELKVVITDEPVEGNEKHFSGLRSDARYYVGVKAKSDNYISEESLLEAWGISAPEVMDASEVTDEGYIANWKPTPNAAAYLLTLFDVQEINEDKADFCILSEDFEKVSGLTDDFDNPVKIGGFEEILWLDDYTASSGWYGAGVIGVDGCIGCSPCYIIPGMYAIVSPTISLGNNSGNYQVKVTVWGCKWSSLAVFSSTRNIESEMFTYTGLHELVFDLSGGTNHEQIGFYTVDGQPFLLDAVEIVQNLSEGDKVLTAVGEYEAFGKETSLKVRHPAKEGFERAYDIMAARAEYSRNALSDYSVPMVVKRPTNVVKGVSEGTADRVYVDGGKLVVVQSDNSPIEVFDIAGRVVVSENGKCGINELPLSPGIYIVKTSGLTVKVILPAR